jgi:AmiR/NasT family two-component response regulator
VAYRSEIYQASGMVSFQMGISADEALVRLRAYAFAENRPLSDVAADIVHRRLRLADDFDPGV